MKRALYEGNVGSYSFIMNDEDIIEVWSDGEYPESFIYVSPGSITSEKKFHYEISDWFIKNVK
jgi:hypothetical protein